MAIQETGGSAVGGGQLQPPARGHVGALDLADHRSDAAMTQRILHRGKDLAVLARLDEQDGARTEARLLEARRIQVEPADRPQHDAIRTRKPRRRAGGKQGRGSDIGQSWRGWCDLVQPIARQPAISEMPINRLHLERQRRAKSRTHMTIRNARAQRRD